MEIFEKVRIALEKIPLKRCDAIVLFTGEGEVKRIIHAVRLFQKGYAWKLVAAGGTLDPCFESLIANLLGDTANCIFSGANFTNTHQQAVWVSETLRRNPEIRSAIVVSAWYHLPRTFLTFLKVLIDNNQKIELATSSPQGGEIYEIGFITAEERKIIDYQQEGDVATLGDLNDYLNRLEKYRDLD